MWDFLEVIASQLGNTLKWLFYGFVFTILIVYVLRKKKLLAKNGVLGTIKIFLYYIVFSITIGITSWFYAATKHVEHDANQMSEIVIDSVEDAIFPTFEKYIAHQLQEYIDVIDIPTNDEIVTEFLLEDEESNWVKKKILHWTLVETLEYLEKEALEKAGIPIDIDNLNINALKIDKRALDVPFDYLKGKSKKAIHSLASSYYTIYYTIYGLVILILVLDIYLSTKKRKRNLDDSLLIENENLEIE